MKAGHFSAKIPGQLSAEINNLVHQLLAYNPDLILLYLRCEVSGPMEHIVDREALVRGLLLQPLTQQYIVGKDRAKLVEHYLVQQLSRYAPAELGRVNRRGSRSILTFLPDATAYPSV
jgi:hypothetical protein